MSIQLSHSLAWLATENSKTYQTKLSFQGHNNCLAGSEEVRKKLGLSRYVSKFLPIQGNPMFSPGLQYEPFSKWRDKGLTNAYALYHGVNNTLKPFQLLAKEFNLPSAHFLHIIQYADFISKTCPKRILRFQPSFVDKLFADNRHSISEYTTL